MRQFTILFFLLICISLTVFSQKLEEKTTIFSSPIDSLKDLNRADTLKEKLATLNAGAHSKLDTLKLTEAKLQAIAKLPQSKSDSIINKINNTVNSTEQKILHPFDSLQLAINSKVQRLEKKITDPIDSVRLQINSRIKSAQNKFTQPIDSVQQSINKTLTTFRDNGSSLTGEDTYLPGLTSENKQLNVLQLPKKDVPTLSTDQLKVNLTNDKPLSEVKLPQAELPKLSAEKLKDMTGLKEVTEVKSQIGKVDAKLVKVEGYASDVQKIGEGNFEEVKELPKEVEKQALKLEGVKEFQGQTDKFNATQKSYEALIQKYKDKKLLQEEMKSKSVNLANDLVNKDMPGVKDAQTKMAKAKRVYGNFQSLKDLPKKRANEMREKSFYQRLVPGFGSQIYQSNKVIIDIAPQIGYRFTERFTSGLAYVYRIGADKHYQWLLSNQGVYGGRAFAQYNVIKTFFLQGEMEYLHISPRGFNNLILSEDIKSDVLQTNLGIGKFFNLSPKIRGNASAFYRLEWSGTLPHQSKFNLRFGIDYVFTNIGRSRLRKAKLSN